MQKSQVVTIIESALTNHPELPHQPSMSQTQPTPTSEFKSWLHDLWADKYTSLNFVALIQWRLKQFRLYPAYYDEVDVILRAYDIALKKIGEGKVIRNKKAWFNSVCFNVIRDLSKKRASDEKLIQKLRDKTGLIDLTQETVATYSSENNIKALFQALEELTDVERKILILREVEEYEWKEIGELLVTSGAEINNKGLIARVRQTGHRSLKKLRQKFYTYI